LHILREKNEVTNELAKLGSSQAMIPTCVFLQELLESGIPKALAKTTKAIESSQETPPPRESITESPKVMEIHSDWRTPFMIYLRTRGLLEDKVDHE
jgi:primosomal protein N''